LSSEDRWKMKLTAFTDYSLRALMFLAVHPDRLCTTKEIAETFQISQNHMVKVAYQLSKLGYVETQKGKNGGMKLSRPPEDLNLGEAIRGLEPDFHLVECFNRKDDNCRISSACQFKSVLFEAQSAFLDVLDGYTLAQITENELDLLGALGAA